VPRHVLGGVGYTAPSDRLNIAAIGAGGKGASDIRNASVGGREKVVALCDVRFLRISKEIRRIISESKALRRFFGRCWTRKKILMLLLFLPQTTFMDRQRLCYGAWDKCICSKANDAK